MENVQIVIPIAGKSQRYSDYGYQIPKYLIEFQGLPMLGHILAVFKDFVDIILIANNVDAERFNLQSIVDKYHNSAKVVVVDTHDLGPSYSILLAKNNISVNKKIIVHYCDFSGVWDPHETVKLLDNNDGVFVTFTGFHPSRVNGTKFAYCTIDTERNLTEIKEKGSFTNDPDLEFASAGIYGFSNGRTLIEHIISQTKNNLQINGEYYTSLTQSSMLKEHLRIKMQDMQFFWAWGTPEDLESYIYFHSSCNRIKEFSNQKNAVVDHSGIILAAGKSSRLTVGDSQVKQLKVIGSRRLVDFSKELICDLNDTFAVFTSNVYNYSTWNLVMENMKIVTHATESQLDSVRIGISLIRDKTRPVSFLASDNIIIFEKQFRITEIIKNCDVLIWTSKNYPISRIQPDQYSWVKTNDENFIEEIKYKSAPIDVRNWKILTGNFTFRNFETVNFLLEKYISNLTSQDREPMLDDLAIFAKNLGLVVKALDVPNYLTLGSKIENDIFDYYYDFTKLNEKIIYP